MNNRFFSSLALRNIRSNKQMYIPYLLSSLTIVAMFYLMSSLLTNKFVQDRSASLWILFIFGCVVIGIFSIIFILYINSFLIKRRKKEIGLYGILGLEKKHVAKVLFFETLFTSLLSIMAGLLAGLIFGRLFFMLLNFMLRLPTDIEYSTNLLTAGATSLFFFGIFGITYLYNISHFTFSKPIKLLKGKQEGEKEPKGSIILFILSLIFLGWGYQISMTIADPLEALTKFFLAVLLVIVGTYLLFISGSIFILKAMKKNKRIYYRPGAFISISGMLYRMKQNAVGLANICILASMVIIAVSTTVTMFVGAEETLKNRYSYENNINVFGDRADIGAINSRFLEVQDQFRKEAEAAGLSVTEMESYRFQTMIGNLEDKKFVFQESSLDEESPVVLDILPLADFNQMSGNSYSLADDEALFYQAIGTYEEDSLTIGEQTYQVTPIEYNFGSDTASEESITLVVPDTAHIEQAKKDYEQQFPGNTYLTIDGNIGWNTTGTKEEKQEFANEMNTKYGWDAASGDILYTSQILEREEWYSLNGGFLFLGVFLGLLFTIGTVLITYFKQVSEGFDDREKFQIMQKVGLDKEMIHDSTRSQIVWMFLLPIVFATIHVSFAYPIVRQLLVFFGVTNDRTWLLSFIGVVIAFAAIYWMIYRVTSKVYYSIVK